MNETKLTKKLTKAIESSGGYVVPIVAGRRGKAGVPDRVVVHRLWTGLLEIKVKNNRCSGLQRIMIGRMRTADPSRVAVVRLNDDLSGALEDEHGEPLLGTTTNSSFGDPLEMLSILRLYSLFKRNLSVLPTESTGL